MSHQPQPRRRPDKADKARVAAWRVLRDVDERGSYANLVLSQHVNHLEDRDRAFATELAYGTLRATGQLDHVITSISGRAISEIDPPMLDVIRLGTYQLLHMRVPSHAAVATSVELARSVTGEGSSRFANGVLRRIAEHVTSTDSIPAQVLAPPKSRDPVGWLSIVHAHPRWIVEAFADALDGDLEQVERALEADNARPVTHLVARGTTREALLAEVAAAGLTANPAGLSPRSVILEHGDPAVLPSVRSGGAGVQDEGSQLIALALAAIDAPRGAVLDLCAGPGGKAALLKSLINAPLIAVEPRAARARLVDQSLSRVEGVSVTVRADGRTAPVKPGAATKVLVDAPCTGLGALRRRPESRWRRIAADVSDLVPLQRDLLHEALDVVVSGGVVAYSTCSPHLAETVGVIEAVMAKRHDVELENAVAAMAAVATRPLRAGSGPFVQLWPHRHGTDAMFLALLRKR